MSDNRANMRIQCHLLDMDDFTRELLSLQSEFPTIVIPRSHPNRAFAKILQDAVNLFNYAELLERDQKFFRQMHSDGVKVASTALNRLGHNAAFNLSIRMGEVILGHISRANQRTYFPANYFRIGVKGKDVVLQCVSFVQLRTTHGRAYSSRFQPTVEFHGKKYIVAFTPTVIAMVHYWLNQKRMSYTALGDTHAFFEQCQHFEPCQIRADGERDDMSIEAISFFDKCGSQRIWNRSYINEILGNNYERTNDKAYHRVGYCPVVLEGDYALATSFLPPGFASTPEHELISTSNLTNLEKERILNLSTSIDDMIQLCLDRDFSVVRHFHESGIPQVVQSQQDWFLPHDE